ncbi:SDR family NAD(P)-dependent oxidoreductase [Thiorhodococcus mannitoliphagus]|uniref:SDR family NAD(P)-dependent oxidoreductase n=1 Tax=Thiorhodococcus mannitoliphagus TaxID=329406 RepID=A0A6P1DYG4_9GAMM|nr:SDR family NAD(P)-dependent oxidoreductase [Thiorhodococcus mannitoliphagus]NEX23357.1 SDR family NAD(P)-dependent oxidoreductase [Thiorhodococcus mannitoliphagus]
MQDLAGKTLIITGAAGNLGRATAKAFAAAGATLALVGRDQLTLQQAQAELPPGTKSATFALDLIDPQQSIAMASEVRSSLGQIYGLANIAGGFAMGPAVDETRPEDWDAMLSLNLQTAVNCARAVIPQLREAGAGRIVNVSARAATQGAAKMAPYCVSKAAIITLTESLAEELKHAGITANCVLPGTLDTPQNRLAMPDQDHSTWVSPEALADVILFLTSHAARCVTGAAIPVYGRS